jgi:RNA methyltransferase, TrmH family
VETITSLQNPVIKKYQRLKKSRRFRQRTNSMAIEGPNLVQAALKRKILPEAVIISDHYYHGKNEDWLEGIPSSIRIIVIPESLFTLITETETPQAVAAIVPYIFSKGIEDLHTGDLVLIVDRVQDPGNMGTIIRTAAAAGVDLLFYNEGCADPSNPKVLRSTAGSIFQANIREISDPRQLLSQLKKKGFLIVAAAGDGDHPYWAVDYNRPVALIIGNEAGGIADDLLKMADLVAAIPLQGCVESLNAAIATGIILFEIRRQKTAGPAA